MCYYVCLAFKVFQFRKKTSTYFDLLHYQHSLTAYVSNLSNCQIFISDPLMSGHFGFLDGYRVISDFELYQVGSG
jgi:hypothetical protein